MTVPDDFTIQPLDAITEKDLQVWKSIASQPRKGLLLGLAGGILCQQDREMLVLCQAVLTLIQHYRKAGKGQGGVL